ncbi:flagellar hook-length control protein FliK [Gracilibacillus boraciitolerans JCM 21714]|uniref:Flagellar hook-length control protein FliK n=1 Tax=Gracilibacillus boraciitolerans JCM 21714 TaxID=1298598 RepID=W4VEJ9_9BACI|nr:flagellar hook-length control protein FliK [Gracilibacillus boraciitolerans]GAE91627.1 flagellar hook-length control protein FliK [Gracilibacillus boraciitolerans JCM 21714]
MFIAANILSSSVIPQLTGSIRSQVSGSSSFQQQLFGANNVKGLDLNQNKLESLLESLPEEIDVETLKQLKELLNGNQTDSDQLQQLVENFESNRETKDPLAKLLTKEIDVDTLKNLKELLSGNQTNLAHLPELSTKQLALIEELSIIFQDSKTISKTQLMQSVQPDQLETLAEIITMLSQQENSTEKDTWINQIMVVPVNSILNTKDQSEKVTSIVNQVEALLNKLEQNKLTNQDVKQLQDVLKQWSQLDQSAKTNAQALLAATAHPKSNEVWNKLLENFQNRLALEKNYGQSQKVTQQDIAKWISNALENQGGNINQEQSQSKTELQTLMNQQVNSKVQQFVIHTQQTNTDQQLAQKQLMEQFQQAIQKSNFMKMTNGASQLMLRLQPEHLGDVMVKLTQVNGEMIVKMIVASQGAKELLEGNLNQLRHMFSPQQVVIERQENLTQTGQEKLSDENNDSLDENSQNQSDQHDGQQNDSEEQEQINFHDLLMDAKV